MLLRELLNNVITEVSMAPGRLSKLASTINARCGIEFELYYPVATDEEEPEPDFDQDEDTRDISDIIEFFGRNYANERRELNDLKDRLNDEFNDYRYEKLNSEWNEKKEDLVADYIRENDWDEDDQYQTAYEKLDYTPEQIEIVENIRNYNDNDLQPGDYTLYEKARNKVDAEFADYVDTSIHFKDRNYDDAYDEFREENEDNIDEYDFLHENGYSTMQEVYDRIGGFTWPYLTDTNSISMDDIAEQFKNETGYDAVGCEEAHYCDDYKGERFVIEKDTSLIEPEPGYGGIEVVSPILSLEQMKSTLNDVIKWANDNDCYTDINCGLHMNVSLEGVEMKNVDFIKLALFIGDDYILNQFNRIGSKYAQQTLKLIKQTINSEPERGYNAIDALQRSLSSEAGKLIQTSTYMKYSSINMHDNRVEFRAPGDDWLNTDVKKIVDTLNRYIVALSIASDPEQHKEEYAKKLYKLLHTTEVDKKISQHISDYMANKISTDELTQLVNLYKVPHDKTKDRETNHVTNLTNKFQSGKMTPAQYQQALTMKQEPPAVDKIKGKIPIEWQVIGPNGEQETFIGPKTEMSAINQMRELYKLNSTRYPNNMFKVKANYQTDIFKDI